MVQFLSAFQAWVNLDFGIATCFFDGYDIYISTWTQFLFPIYIWLLILLIVIASRYSRRVSNLTTSNTVQVLATLLLLSYSKLLLTTIDALSFTNLLDVRSDLESDKISMRVWLLDGSPYLKGKHISLFLVSLFWGIGFILPFTLLVLLGPLIQAKSQYKIFGWINKLKPLLDAFYGPYTSTYRYWPGILLLARLGLFNIAAFYSLGDTPYKFVIISVIILLMLFIWILLVRTYAVLPYQRKWLNYLELFFHLNLGIFTVSSTYFRLTKTDSDVHQQVLAIVMVGAAFLVSCGIVTFQIIAKFVAGKKLVPHKISQKMVAEESLEGKQDAEAMPTQSTVDMDNFTAAHSVLREPLLAN